MAKKKVEKLVPPDLVQCQAEKPSYTGWSFMTLGPPPKLIRCTNAPKWIAVEGPRDDAKKRGSMSLCDECKKVCQKQMPTVDFAPFVHKLTWREVLDCKVHCGHISKMVELAIETGYEYISWNDNVWRVVSNREAVQLDIRIGDIK